MTSSRIFCRRCRCFCLTCGDIQSGLVAGVLEPIFLPKCQVIVNDFYVTYCAVLAIDIALDPVFSRSTSGLILCS